MSLYDYDEFIKKHCGRMSLLNQAKTGYNTESQFDQAYNDLYTNPKVQRDFGVEELAYMPSSKQGILNHLMTDHKVSEGSVNFGGGFVPPIEGGVFVRDRPLFDKDGKYEPPPTDGNDPNDELLQRYRDLQSRRQAEQRILVEQATQEEARRIAEQTTQRELDEYYSKRIDLSGLGSARKEARERQGFQYSYTAFTQLPDRESKVEHLVQRFFGGDASAFVDWQNSERQSRAEGRRFQLPVPYDQPKDLEGEFAAAAEEPAGEASGSGQYLSAEEREAIDEMAESLQ